MRFSVLFLILLFVANTTSSQTYNYYFGNLHSHTGFSDGSVLPNAAFYIGNQTAVGVFIGDETTTITEKVTK